MLYKHLKVIIKNVRRYSTTTANKTGKRTNNFDFSEKDQNRILNVLNVDEKDHLCRLNIPQSEIRKLEVWKTKYGPFQCMNNLLDVEGMDVENLAKICHSVVSNKPIQNAKKLNNSKNRQIISPNLPSNIVDTLTSVVGLYLGPTGIGWTKLSCTDRKVIVWDYKDFSDISPKASPFEIFELALCVSKCIPVGEVFVFEALPRLGLQGQGQIGPLTTYLQQVEFNSMLLALLNTSQTHNIKKLENIVYHLKTKLPARLFQTWVGTEKVTAITTVNALLRGENELPCTPVDVDEQIKIKFEGQSSIRKEILSQSLLLSIAFLDLCVYKNPVSLRAIAPSKKR
ncbi:hypothetical protein HHI36_020079 [Cryptolaemus montrouzieri]|uniref:Transcription elongation factor, mitochondrial n=1 Tax=Cryptolaemus montrouzieri TaxID=559131 RepID=A0ABD2N9J6_9CUCU